MTQSNIFPDMLFLNYFFKLLIYFLNDCVCFVLHLLQKIFWSINELVVILICKSYYIPKLGGLNRIEISRQCFIFGDVLIKILLKFMQWRVSNFLVNVNQ